ncbi:MAG: hypothetical protein ABR915_10975 [Thermoguttaceae bacterium]|jgi:hypothetical protein
MNAIALGLFFLLTAADPPPGAAVSDTNPLLAELTEKGVDMPDGTAIQLPPPVLKDGADRAAALRALEEKIGPISKSVEQFSLKIRKPDGKQGKQAIYRRIDVGFIAHGRWEILNSEKFADNFLKTAKQQAEKAKNEDNGKAKEKEGGEAAEERMLSKSGLLTEEEMQRRGLGGTPKRGIEERYFYTTLKILDRVEVSATRHAVLTQRPGSLLLAARVDPRFVNDPEYPNQWRSVDRDAAARIVYGPKHPYSGAGFYVKITRLAGPDGGIFVEYHGVYNEPAGWFPGDENALRAKLPLVAQQEVKQFRMKLRKASEAEKKP